jgi:hypothetical protein
MTAIGTGMAKVRIQGWVKNPDGTHKGNFDIEGLVDENALKALQETATVTPVVTSTDNPQTSAKE